MPLVDASRVAEADHFLRLEFLQNGCKPMQFSRWYDGTWQAEQDLTNRWVASWGHADTPEDEAGDLCSGELLALLELAIGQLADQGFVTVTLLSSKLADEEPDYLIHLTNKGRAWAQQQTTVAAPPGFVSLDL